MNGFGSGDEDGRSSDLPPLGLVCSLLLVSYRITFPCFPGWLHLKPEEESEKRREEGELIFRRFTLCLEYIIYPSPKREFYFKKSE